MKLAVLLDLNSPWSTQAGLQLAACAKQTHIVTIDTESSGERGGFIDPLGKALIETADSVHRLKAPFRSKLSYFALAPKLGAILKSCGCDLLLSLAGGWHGTLAYLSGFRPYVVYVVGSDVLLCRGLKRMLTVRVLRAAAMTFANGETLARKTQALCSRTRTRPLYLGIDTNRFVPANRSTTNVNIICTRRFEPLYNNQYLIDGLARLPRCRADVTTTFASYGELLPAAKEYARQRLSPQMFARMHFLGGTSLENLVERLASADIYVSLSWSDGTSISLLEAMACGAFPILSDIPQNREWIDPRGTTGSSCHSTSRTFSPRRSPPPSTPPGYALSQRRPIAI
jgi:glycosyltransferase involved in cell wall biosynthesis